MISKIFTENMLQMLAMKSSHLYLLLMMMLDFESFSATNFTIYNHSSPLSNISSAQPPVSLPYLLPQLNQMECTFVLNGLIGACRRERAAKTKSNQFKQKPPPPTTTYDDNESACCKAHYKLRCLKAHLVRAIKRTSIRAAACQRAIEESVLNYQNYYRVSCNADWNSIEAEGSEVECSGAQSIARYGSSKKKFALLSTEVLFSLFSSLLSYLLATRL